MKTDVKEQSKTVLITKINVIESTTVVLPIENIDTDQIIPARFLKTTSKEGLGDNLFLDWRYKEDGSPNPDFPLNKPEAKGAQVLVAGDNFGCGSSREHAPWALAQYGFRAIISTSFADIFRGNALKNGLLPIVVPEDAHKEMLSSSSGKVRIDLSAQTLTTPGGRAVHFDIDPFAKQCLLDGVDELGYMLQQDPSISAFEKARAGSVNTLA